jgi:cupin 2 domain-containing protein
VQAKSLIFMRTQIMQNIFQNIPASLSEEFFETLVRGEHTQIKRIVSSGHTTDWYDQDKNEFVLVLQGGARLEFENGRLQELGAGDWLQIPAHVKHRVAWTREDEETVWLAVHYR